MDWFRWHHGSVTDPKFQLVARKAGSSVAEVIAVWATLLEAASMADERGDPGPQDFEAIDCSLGLQDGKSAAIHAEMTTRGLLETDGTVSAWARRQPKREREDLSTERTRRHKERQGTPENAKEHTGTPRGDKRRVEEKTTKTADEPPGFVRFWSAWPKSDRKGSKGKCLEAWRKAGAELRAEPIVSHVERLKSSPSWTKDGGQFIPAPSTYLNQRRWEGADADSANDDPYGLRTAL